MCTHILCFEAKIRKKVYPCKRQFYNIKVGCTCKGVFVTRTYLCDVRISKNDPLLKARFEPAISWSKSLDRAPYTL